MRDEKARLTFIEKISRFLRKMPQSTIKFPGCTALALRSLTPRVCQLCPVHTGSESYRSGISTMWVPITHVRDTYTLHIHIYESINCVRPCTSRRHALWTAYHDGKRYDLYLYICFRSIAEYERKQGLFSRCEIIDVFKRWW